MARTILHLDFETRSAADLRKVGLDVYVAHPSTEVLCAAYAFDEEPVQIWRPLRQGEPAPVELLMALEDPEVELHAYNAPFELGVINQVCTLRYGWPAFSHKRARCVMAMSYALGMPGSLENVAIVLQIPEQKDMEGGRLMVQYSQPRDVLPCENCKGTGVAVTTALGGCPACGGAGSTIVWWTDPAQLERVYKYCINDVVVERAVEKKLLPLSPYEQKVWCLDYEINRRGCAVDVASVGAAIKLVETEKARLNDEIRRLTNNAVASCSAVQQIKDHLELYGVSGESLDKAAVVEHLGAKDLHPTARRILQLRAEAGRAATSKFAPMVERAGEDARLRGCYQYSGAGTRRWAGRGVQLHNLQRQRTKFKILSALIDDIRNGSTVDELTMFYGPPMTLLGECTRSFLWAPTDAKEIMAADFAAIEARVVAWLAGQENILEVFRRGEDVYKVAAAAIFGCRPDQVTDEQRQVGKVAILALGYGGGVGAFQTMAKGYGVTMAPAFDYLMSVATPEQRIRAEATYKNYLTKETNAKTKEKDLISRKEFLASDLTKIFWREANPNIVSYWYALEDAAIQAVGSPGKVFTAGMIKYRKVGSWLLCQLPGGGVISYPFPQVKEIETPWGAKKHGLTYMAEDAQSRRWMRWKTYGGSLCENVTQATSRDVQADAMLRLDSAGFSIVLHTHDEIASEEFKNARSIEEMIALMVQRPAWAAGLPIAAAGGVDRRYRKH